MMYQGEDKLCSVAGVCSMNNMTMVMLFIEKHSIRHTFNVSADKYRLCLNPLDGFMIFSFSMDEPNEDQIEWLQDHCEDVLIHSLYVDGTIP